MKPVKTNANPEKHIRAIRQLFKEQRLRALVLLDIVNKQT